MQCTVCGRVIPTYERYWLENTQVVCDRCAGKHESDLVSNDNKAVRHSHALCLIADGKPIACWIGVPQQCFPLTEEEDKRDPFDLIHNVMFPIHVRGFRCTDCGEEFTGEPVGRPLFAGAVCQPCWHKHLRKLEEEKTRGHVCGFCGKPYSACCC